MQELWRSFEALLTPAPVEPKLPPPIKEEKPTAARLQSKFSSRSKPASHAQAKRASQIPHLGGSSSIPRTCHCECVAESKSTDSETAATCL
ncbi:hypothetical protein O181_044466 [Austropuccinia psidii MF-1]|uniref:Uncharacterized protein n=1 Tax=Austropuccinia psidii MF-1 TaxID=1389203 RepID=A0A9Q3DIG6_9BASI|nr:hypothetical protein [Austropuccinia psidii MF-1]